MRFEPILSHLHGLSASRRGRRFEAAVRGQIFAFIWGAQCNDIAGKYQDGVFNLPAEKIRCITSEHRPSRKQKIEDADIVIAGGRGMGSKGKFKKLFELAGLMHGDVAIVADANQVCLGIIRALKEKIRD